MEGLLGELARSHGTNSRGPVIAAGAVQERGVARVDWALLRTREVVRDIGVGLPLFSHNSRDNSNGFAIRFACRALFTVYIVCDVGGLGLLLLVGRCSPPGGRRD